MEREFYELEKTALDDQSVARPKGNVPTSDEALKDYERVVAGLNEIGEREIERTMSR